MPADGPDSRDNTSPQPADSGAEAATERSKVMKILDAIGAAAVGQRGPERDKIIEEAGGTTTPIPKFFDRGDK